MELRKKYDEAEARANDLKSILQVQRAACSNLNNWSERFDIQETMEKKAMLISLIEKVTIYDEEIEVQYKIRFDKSDETEYNNMVNNVESAKQDELDVFSCLGFAQRGTLSKTEV